MTKRNWPMLRFHFCGWDAHCRKYTDLGDGPSHRVHLGLGPYWWYLDLLDWEDRGKHHRTWEEWKRLRREPPRQTKRPGRR